MKNKVCTCHNFPRSAALYDTYKIYKVTFIFWNDKIFFALRTSEEIKNIAYQVIEDEKKAIEQLAASIDDNFAAAVEMIFSSPGRVVITGIGKSAIIAKKIVSTMNSTGTPSMFLHAADAMHGDLGMIQPNDVVICISKSGNTPEIKTLIPHIKNFGNKIIAIVGNRDSFLASESDVVLDTTVAHEADPNNLAPTNSTTSQLVMGDALAVALIHCRDFKAHDFARYHPGGALGKKLYVKVDDLYRQNGHPAVTPDASVRDTVLEMTSKRLGCTVVVDKTDQTKVLGIICDGDLRRMMKQYSNIDHLKAGEIMTACPKCVRPQEYAIDALNVMRYNAITQLVVVDDKGAYIGMLHLHDILREGIL